jgi:hypothetical protein
MKSTLERCVELAAKDAAAHLDGKKEVPITELTGR